MSKDSFPLIVCGCLFDQMTGSSVQIKDTYVADLFLISVLMITAEGDGGYGNVLCATR